MSGITSEPDNQAQEQSEQPREVLPSETVGTTEITLSGIMKNSKHLGHHSILLKVHNLNNGYKVRTIIDDFEILKQGTPYSNEIDLMVDPGDLLELTLIIDCNHDNTFNDNETHSVEHRYFYENDIEVEFNSWVNRPDSPDTLLNTPPGEIISAPIYIKGVISGTGVTGDHQVLFQTFASGNIINQTGHNNLHINNDITEYEFSSNIDMTTGSYYSFMIYIDKNRNYIHDTDEPYSTINNQEFNGNKTILFDFNDWVIPQS